MKNSIKFDKKFNASSRTWLTRQQNDIYVKRAVNEGYRSRAAYKLMEIDNKFRLIKAAKKIIDIGASPGGWSQVLDQRSCPDSKIAAIDLLNFAPVSEKVTHFFGDFEDKGLQRKIANFLDNSADLIVSDMAPATIGHRQSDHWRIMRLVESAYHFSQGILREGGAFLAKIFHGGDEKEFFEKIRNDFNTAKFFKPKSSRSESTEVYVIGIGYKGDRRDDEEKCVDLQ